MKKIYFSIVAAMIMAGCKPTTDLEIQPASDDLSPQTQVEDFKVDNRCRTSICPTLNIETAVDSGDATDDGTGLLATENQKSEWAISATIPEDPTRRVKIFLDEKPSSLSHTFNSDVPEEKYTMELEMTPTSNTTFAAIFILRDMDKCLQVVGSENYSSKCEKINEISLGTYDQEENFVILVDENEREQFEELLDAREANDNCLRRKSGVNIFSRFVGGGLISTIHDIFSDC